jgi:dTMP kinase
MNKGKFIVIDGSDGSGKATQIEYLHNRLKEENYLVDVLDFPQYNKGSSYFVKNYLNGKYGKADEVSEKLASLFYALDRFDARDEAKKKLGKGINIIVNRYVGSSAGHQGGKINDPEKRKEYLKWLYNLEYNICGNPKPDLNLYLHVPWEIGQKLIDKKEAREYIKGKKRDIHEDDSEHLKKAQQSYIKLVEEDPDWKRVDCIKDGELMSREEIHEKVWKVVKEIL